MTLRIRKLIAVMSFVVMTTVYGTLAITVAIVRLPGTPLWTQLLFYAVATLIWFLISAWIIWWAAKRRPSDALSQEV